jgi:hypothetical protein
MKFNLYLLPILFVLTGCFGPSPAQLKKEKFLTNIEQHKAAVCELAKKNYPANQKLYGKAVDPDAKCVVEYEFSISTKPYDYIIASNWVRYGTFRKYYTYSKGTWSN